MGSTAVGENNRDGKGNGKGTPKGSRPMLVFTGDAEDGEYLVTSPPTVATSCEI